MTRALPQAQPLKSGWVSPFGHLRIKGCSAPPRSLSQLATSFIASSKSRHPPYALMLPVREAKNHNYITDLSRPPKRPKGSSHLINPGARVEVRILEVRRVRRRAKRTQWIRRARAVNVPGPRILTADRAGLLRGLCRDGAGFQFSNYLRSRLCPGFFPRRPRRP